MRKILLCLVALATAGLIWAGCGKSSSGPGPCDYVGGAAGATAQFHLDASCNTNPFPSDVLLGSGGLVSIPGSRFDYVLPRTAVYDTARAYIAEIAAGLDSDGFSTVAPILVSLDLTVSTASVPAGVHFFVFTNGAAVPDGHLLVPSWNNDLRVLELQPATPLSPRTKYGVVVSAQLVDGAGNPTARAPDFQSLLDRGAPADLSALLTAAANAGVATPTVAEAFTFTTQTETDDMVKVRDQVFGSLGSSLTPSFATGDPLLPGLVLGLYTNGSAGFQANVSLVIGVVVTNLGAVATGAYDSYDFRGGDKRPFQAAYVDGTTTPPTNHLDFRMTIPRGTPPATGWPLVYFQHGLGGSDLDVYTWGNKLAPFGYAVVAINAVEHGLRGAGVVDFFDWTSMPGTRESFRQTNADQMQVVRMARNARAAGIAPFNQIDPSDTTYFGISLGGILGSGFVSLTPGNSKGLLIVPGDHLSYELFASQVGKNYLWPFVSTYSRIDYLTDPNWNIFLESFENLIQVGLDRGDPGNYATHVITPGAQLPGVPPKKVLMIYSQGDGWVPNVANEAVRAALGIPRLTAAATSAGGISAAWLYSKTDFPQVGNAEPHGYFSILCQAQKQAWTWIVSGGTTVIDPLTATCP